MAEKSRGRRFAGVAALMALSLVLVWWWTRGGDDADSPGRDGRTSARQDGSPGRAGRWLPWFGGGGGSGVQGDEDYRGPRVPVRVRVVDLDGNPVSGAIVDARVDREEWETAGLTEEEYEEYLRRKYGNGKDGEPAPEDPWAALEERWEATRESVVSGRTGTDGVYLAQMKPHLDVVFQARDGNGRAGVSPALYTYVLEPPGDDHADDGFDAASEDPSVVGGMFEVLIEIAHLSTLTGVVFDERGRPIPGAAVSLMPWDGALSAEEIIETGGGEGDAAIGTDADGKFRVSLRASGAIDVEVRAKGFQPILEQAVQVLPGRETTLSLTMLPSAEITGVVLDPAGTPLAQARVMVQTSATANEFFATETTTSEDGTFVVEELAPGRYIVVAESAGFRPVEQWETQAGTGRDVVLRLTTGGRILGTVRADVQALFASRRPAAEVIPEIPAEGPALYGDVYLALAGDAPPPGAPVEIGNPRATGVPAGQEMLSPSGVVDVRGRYVGQVIVDAGGNGTFEISGTPPGTYDLTLTVGAAVARRTALRVHDGGATQVFVDLPDRSAASIAGVIRTTDGRTIESASVFLYGSGLPSGLSAWPDVSGAFEFRSVPPGKYLVHASALVASSDDPNATVSALIRATEITVPASGRVPLELVAEVLDLDAIVIGDVWDDADHVDVLEDLLPEEEPDLLYMPDVSIEDIGGRLVVTAAPPGSTPRLFGGDRVTSIDGALVSADESWEALEMLYGPEGSLCRIAVERPASGESFSVSLPRSKNAYELDGHFH